MSAMRNFTEDQIMFRDAYRKFLASEIAPHMEDWREAGIVDRKAFKQAGDLYRSFSKKERQDLIENFGGSLATTDDESKHIILSFLYKADPEYGTGVSNVAKGDLARVKALAAKLVD